MTTVRINSRTAYGDIHLSGDADGYLGLSQAGEPIIDGEESGAIETMLIDMRAVPALVAAMARLHDEWHESTRPLLRDVPTAGEA